MGGDSATCCKVGPFSAWGHSRNASLSADGAIFYFETTHLTIMYQT
jgi:hypothetical protein